MLLLTITVMQRVYAVCVEREKERGMLEFTITITSRECVGVKERERGGGVKTFKNQYYVK